MIYLTKKKIILINQKTVEIHGGSFMPPSNFLHEYSSEYVLEAVQTEMFGQPMYPSITDKTAVYCLEAVLKYILNKV